MKRINTSHIRKGSSTNLYTTLRQFLSTFGTRHTGVFEALTRSATPFGGNWLTPNDRPADVKPAGAVRNRPGQVRRSTSRKAAAPTEIGINRFRALQTEL